MTDLELPGPDAYKISARGTENKQSWRKANERRPSIAQDLCIAEATFTFREKSDRQTRIDARRLAHAVSALKALPRAGEYVHIITGQEFTGFDLLPAMLDLAEEKSYDSLTLTTLGFSKNNLVSLAEMIHFGRIQPATLRILCSDFFRRSDTDIWAIASEQAERMGYGFRSTRNHTKIILGRIKRNCYVVESSANLRSCSNLEQFVITQSAGLFKFHAAWIDQVWAIAEK